MNIRTELSGPDRRRSDSASWAGAGAEKTIEHDDDINITRDCTEIKITIITYIMYVLCA